MGTPRITLRGLRPDDLPLYEAINLDPAMMAGLGGPSVPPEGLAEKVRRDAAAHDADQAWIFVIVPGDQPQAAAGSVSVWRHESHGEPIEEIGWMVLPPFQGKGIGKEAVRMVLDRARETRRWVVLNAFPSVTNEASNAMCRSLGFTLIGTNDYEFRGRPLRCNHWRIDLRERAPRN